MHARTPCSEGLENGRFVLEWEISGGFGGDYVNYSRMISGQGGTTTHHVDGVAISFQLLTPVERCRLRRTSSRPVPQHRRLDVVARRNAVVDPGEANFIVGLLLNEFYTLRFESYDGSRHTWAVDGRVYATFVDRPRPWIIDRPVRRLCGLQQA